MAERMKPGQQAKVSGQYERLNARGRRTGQEATVTRGEPLPPTQAKGQTWVLKDKTKHKK